MPTSTKPHNKAPVFFGVIKNDFDENQVHYSYKVSFQGQVMDITNFPVHAFIGAYELQMQSIGAFMPILIDSPQNYKQGLNFLHDLWLAEANNKLCNESTKEGRMVQRLAAKAMRVFADIYPHEAKSFMRDILYIKQQEHEEIVGAELPPLTPRDLRGYMPRQFLDKACAKQEKPFQYQFMGVTQDSYDIEAAENFWTSRVLVLNREAEIPPMDLADINLGQMDNPESSLEFIQNLELFLDKSEYTTKPILHFLANTWQQQQAEVPYQTPFEKARDVGGEVERVMVAFAATHQQPARDYAEYCIDVFAGDKRQMLTHAPKNFWQEALKTKVLAMPVVDC